jgi:hypothetical protein
METTTTVQGVEMEIETIFSDYKEVGDLMMAHSIENRPKGQPGGQTITIQSVETDADMSDVQFSMPASTDQ